MKALLLVGSPRQKGNSAKLGNALLTELNSLGAETQTIYLAQSLKTWEKVAAGVAWTDLLVLSVPLYVDTLSAPATEALTRLADKAAGKKLAVIINCGYPEVSQNLTALRICQQFAREAGCEWVGALALSMGGYSFGKGLSRPVVKAMKLSAQALSQGQPIPERAVTLAARLPMPKWLYLLVLNRTFKRIVTKHGKAPIDARPYRD
jgi:multimeric flavodoxin WrbA